MNKTIELSTADLLLVQRIETYITCVRRAQIIVELEEKEVSRSTLEQVLIEWDKEGTV